MSMKVPPSKFDTELVPGAVKAAAKDAGAKTGEMLVLKIGQIHVMPDFNPRVTGTAEYAAGIAELANSMLAEGYYRDKPMAVFVNKSEDGKDVFFLADGHRRHEAVLTAIQTNPDFDPDIPVVVKPKGTSMEDLLVATTKTGAALSPYEVGIIVKRLVNMGKSVPDVASRLGMTEVYANNLLTLHAAPAKVRNAVMTGKISASAAIAELKADPENAAENIAAAVSKAVAEGRGKAKPKDVKAAGEARKKSGEAKTPAAGSGDEKPEAERTKIAYEIVMKDGEKGQTSMPGFKIAQYIASGAWYDLTENEGEFVAKGDVKIAIRMTRKLPKTEDIDTGGL